MADDKSKKDLTGILEYAKNASSADLPQGEFLKEVPIEKIDDFESLDSYAAAHPESIAQLDANGMPIIELVEESKPQESPPSSSPSPLGEPPQEPSQDLGQDLGQDNAPNLGQGIEQGGAIGGSGTTDSAFAVTPPAEGESGGGFDLGLGTNTGPSFGSIPGMNFDAAPEAAPAQEATPTPEITPTPEPVPELVPTPEVEVSAPAPIPAPAAPSVAVTEPSPVVVATPVAPTTVKVQAPPLVKAGVPFSVAIDGELADSEKEKLLYLITRENMGIREMDLEPQLAAGKVLIPRISEYAAILLVQSLRGIRAEIKIGPADEIYAKSEDVSKELQKSASPQPSHFSYMSSEVLTPAEKIPITSEALPPGLRADHDPLHRSFGHSTFEWLDLLTASGALKSRAIEVESSSEYENLLEALKRELKYKAFRKGAHAIIHFKTQLDLLASPTSYRLTVMGSAIRFSGSVSETLPQ